MTTERLITDWRRILLFAIITSTPVLAQEAVLSFKAVKVNDESIPPSNNIQVVPGDIIEVEIFLSDWSPNGERLESWSVRIEPDGFSSGRIGYVYLPGYVPWYCPFAECGSDGECFPAGLKCVNGCCYGPEVHDNVFIDMTRKDYVFAGLDSSPYVQPLEFFYTDSVSSTVAPAYEQSPKYCGTFILTSSNDACGTFTITKAPSVLNLFSGSDSIIKEVVFEPLTVDVPGDCPLPHPQDSYIQNCSTYPQSWTEPDGSNPSQRSNFLLIFDGSTGGITELDLLATSIPAGEPVEIVSLQLYREQGLLTL